MSSDEELSPESQCFPRSKPTAPVTPDESESDPDDAEEEEKNVDHSYARPRIMWVRKLTINKGEMDDDEAKEKIAGGARAFMESSGLFKLPGQRTNATDCGLWKLGRDWWCYGGKTRVLLYKCPLARRFECKCQVKITENLHYRLLETRGEHNEESHNLSKDKSKYLKSKQLDAIQTGVRVSPQQNARELRRNLVNLSPEKRISPSLMQSLQRKVVKVRAGLTLEQLDALAIDGSFGSLVHYADAKWFPTQRSLSIRQGRKLLG
jgi:hypothetical protein